MKTMRSDRIIRVLMIELMIWGAATAARGQTNALTNVPTRLAFAVEVVLRSPGAAAPAGKPRIATNSPAAPSRELQLFHNREQAQIQQIADSIWKSDGSRHPSLLGALLHPTPRNLYSLIDLSSPLPERGPGTSSSVWSWEAAGGQWPPATPLSSDPSKNMPAGLSLGP
jgi:hypothetical protein